AAFGSTTTSAPPARSAAIFAPSADAAATSTLPPSRTRAPSGTSSRESTSTLSGWRGVSTSRTVRRGSSSLTVPIPVTTAHARARPAAPAMPVAPCRLAGEPLAAAVRERGLAVQRRGDLQPDPGPSTRQARHEPDVQLTRVLLEQSGRDLDSTCA